MEDTVYRRDAIDALRTCYDTEAVTCTNGNEYIDYDQALDLLNSLPSAQTERKKGRWINNSPVTMKCDQCGYVIKDWKWNELNFCANCGADMRGEKDEVD